MAGAEGRGPLRGRADDFDFDELGRALAVAHDGLSQVLAQEFQGLPEFRPLRVAPLNRRVAGQAVGENQHGVVGRSIAVDANAIEGAFDAAAQQLLQKTGFHRGIGGDEAQHGRHVGVNHTRTFGAAREGHRLAVNFQLVAPVLVQLSVVRMAWLKRAAAAAPRASSI